MEAKAISTIEIDASQAYRLVVKATKAPAIHIKAVMEGEYKNDLLINTRKSGGHFKISTSFQPLFKDPNDKLSAHKVISVLLVVELPEHSNLIVSGGNINVTINGNYKTIKANTISGNFTVTDVIGNGEIRNFRGNIFVNNYPGKILPQSRYGKIFGRNTVKRKAVLTLKTVNGNIYINKPK